jgi:hypothetical protein
VEKLPTRELIREWLVNPPDPPFTIAIAESGQKHILFLAKEAQSKDVFPVQFELDSIMVNRSFLIKTLNYFEQLMELGCTKTEIVSGQYKSQNLLANLWHIQEIDENIAKIRGSRLLELISYVAINSVRSQLIPEENNIIESVPTLTLSDKKQINQQLTLF